MRRFGLPQMRDSPSLTVPNCKPSCTKDRRVAVDAQRCSKRFTSKHSKWRILQNYRITAALRPPPPSNSRKPSKASEVLRTRRVGP